MNIYFIEINAIYIFIILILIYFLSKFLLLLRINKFNIRIGTYCIPKKNKINILIYPYCLYKGFVRTISLFLIKIPTFTTYIEQYEKYITKRNKSSVIAADFISNKILVSILFLILILLTKQIKGNIITDVDIIIFILLGYIIPDFYNMIKDNKKNR